jgi:4-diphosphocytidyl-2-C-methyl-D-erythritol kinase
MVSFPNCKINLGLHIISKRTDGYHDLETIFYPVQINDAIEVIEKEDLRFSISGLRIEGEQQNNTCLKAYYLLKKDFPQLPPVQMHLHKSIPLGAGLGGGSADGAFTLQLLNKQFDLFLSEKQLAGYALQLGSDCSFFILNKPCFATGRGELLEQINMDLSDYKILIVHPGIHISTAWAFTQLSGFRQRREPGSYKSIKEIINRPISIWRGELINDFEIPVFSQYPEIKKIKDELYNAGAIYSSMSGSGSAVYGIFEKNVNINLSLSEKYFIKEVQP